MDTIRQLDFSAIETRRLQLGVVQAELCRRASVDPVTYSRLKQRKHVATQTTLRKLADVLEIMAEERVLRLNRIRVARSSQ